MTGAAHQCFGRYIGRTTGCYRFKPRLVGSDILVSPDRHRYTNPSKTLRLTHGTYSVCQLRWCEITVVASSSYVGGFMIGWERCHRRIHTMVVVDAAADAWHCSSINVTLHNDYSSRTTCRLISMGKQPHQSKRYMDRFITFYLLEFLLHTVHINLVTRA
jgi:hypothetical protein